MIYAYPMWETLGHWPVPSPCKDESQAFRADKMITFHVFAVKHQHSYLKT